VLMLQVNLKGLHYLDLKPAIKVYHLIQAIQTKYGITFSTDFFKYKAYLSFMNYFYGYIEIKGIYQSK
jgi:hypothetical protein